MAVEIPLTKQEIASKLLVQEIAKNGDEIPKNYLHNDGFPEAIDAPASWREYLLIDLNLLSSSSPSEIAKLRSALTQWGCFQVINHGIESSFLEELIGVSKQFFALPLEEKLKCSSEADIIQGYGSDAFIPGARTLNWNDRLFLHLYPEEKLKLECWPQKPEKFRGMIDEYAKELTMLNKVICRAMEASLNLEENCLNWGKQGPEKANFIFYPRCSCPERVLGNKPHTDTTTITYLLPEREVQGLQILKDDQWYRIPVIPGALFINFGDLGEVMTNGVFKSVVHRVGTNSVKDRISMAMYFYPDDEEVEPLSGLVGAHQPQRYRKFNMSEYRPKILESFRLGIRLLDAFRV